MLPSIPVGYAVNMKETYNNTKLLLHCIIYNKHQWQFCGELEVAATLFGLQQGYMKFCCFLCEWNIRATTSHYKNRNWTSRKALEEGENVQHLQLPESSKLLLSPLHIKLGLMTNFIRAMDQAAPAFRYLAKKFARMSAAKIKEGVFVGPRALQRRAVRPHSQR